MYNSRVMVVKVLVCLGGFSISCSKFHSAILFTSFLCIQAIPFCISLSYLFLSSLSNARLRHSVFSLFFIKAHIINLIYIVIIYLRIYPMLLIFSTSFLVILQDDIIHFTMNSSIVILLSSNFFLGFRIITTVLGRPAFIIIKT